MATGPDSGIVQNCSLFVDIFHEHVNLLRVASRAFNLLEVPFLMLKQCWCARIQCSWIG